MGAKIYDSTSASWKDAEPKIYVGSAFADSKGMSYNGSEWVEDWGWQYNTGNNEVALLNNIKHPEEETIGKIYYIQAYYHNSNSQYTHATPVVSSGMPYRVIGVNREGTEKTMDLMSLVAANYLAWNSSYNSWTYGKYSTSNIYSWLSSSCVSGYSANIQACMQDMTERWREATGDATGTMMSRTTKCKLLNPVELFGYSAATISPTWEYGNSSDHKTDFANPTGAKYGSLYPVWNDSIVALSNRRAFHDKNMTTANYSWTNSWLALGAGNSNAICFYFTPDGAWGGYNLDNAFGVAPVIRLSANPS